MSSSGSVRLPSAPSDSRPCRLRLGGPPARRRPGLRHQRWKQRDRAPASDKVPNPNGLPIHNGGHLGDYDNYVRTQLKDLDQVQDQLTSAELLEEILRIENRIKDDLVIGKVLVQGQT